jgi:hypothetical protein
LKSATACQLLLVEGLKLARALIDPDKDEIRLGRGFSAFAPQQVFIRLFALPDGGEKRNAGEIMNGYDQAAPKKTNARQNEKAMALHPLHGGLLYRTSAFVNRILLKRAQPARSRQKQLSAGPIYIMFPALSLPASA